MGNNFKDDLLNLFADTIVEFGVKGTEMMVKTKLYDSNRRKRQEKIQEFVNKSFNQDDNAKNEVAECNVQFEVIDRDIDFHSYQEIPMNEDEINEWMSLLTNIGGESVKSMLNMQSFNGLLKCDIPISKLAKVKGDPNALRGYMFNNNGKIVKQGSFTEIGVNNATPLFAFQLMSAITSQYYQHLIYKQLNDIDDKLKHIYSLNNEIYKLYTNDDHATLKVSFDFLQGFYRKTQYNINDLQDVRQIVKDAKVIKEKYRDMLPGINDLNVTSRRSNLAEVNLKIEKLNNSHFLEYYETVLVAEQLTFVASIVGVKIAMSLNLDEDVTMLCNLIDTFNLDDYEHCFRRIKHDVVKYIEKQEEDYTEEEEKFKNIFEDANKDPYNGRNIPLGRKGFYKLNRRKKEDKEKKENPITRLKIQQRKRFEYMETSMDNIHHLINSKVSFLLEKQKDGTLRKLQFIDVNH